MPADKLGRYMRSAEFLKRANKAIAEAVHGLESHGIQPVYLDRKTGRNVGFSNDMLSEDGSWERHAGPDVLLRQAKPNGVEE